MVVIPFAAPRILQGQSAAARLQSRDGARLAHYQDLRDFYDGRHAPARRPGHTQLVANYARAIADKHVAYTFARGILIEGPDHRTHSPMEQALDAILTENGFPRVLLQAATNGVVTGDAVLKVIWAGTARARSPEPGTQAAASPLPAGAPRILSIDPARFFPTFASDDPTTFREVSVVSSIDPDEARERYGLDIARKADLTETWTDRALSVQVANTTVFQGVNPYGFIPYVHVPNLAPPGSPWGISDLEDVIPLNKELDERLSDQADTIRYHADPPVVFKGVRDHGDLAVGPGTIWDIPSDAGVDLLEWRGQTPQVDAHIGRVLRAIYDVSEAPQSSFGDTTVPFSGVALETQLQPIVQRTLRRRITWEPALRDLARMALVLAEQFHWHGLTPGQFHPYELRVHWLPMLPRDDDAEANRYIALTAAGLRSYTGAMEALGVPDPEAELELAIDQRARLGITDEATPAERQVSFVPPAAPGSSA